MIETAKWDDLMKRQGRVTLADIDMPTFWREIQTNPDWQIVIDFIERKPNLDDDGYIIYGCSKLFAPIAPEEEPPVYYLEVLAGRFGKPSNVVAIPIDAKPSATHKTGGSDTPQRAMVEKSIEFIEPDIQSKDLHNAMVNFGKACAESVSLPDWMLGNRDTVDDIGKKLGTAVALDDTEAMDEILGIAEDSDKQAPDPLAITRQLLR